MTNSDLGNALHNADIDDKALARAVYSTAKVMVLDDIFSGLDATSEALIVDRLFGPNGHFRKTNTTVLIATHSSTSHFKIELSGC